MDTENVCIEGFVEKALLFDFYGELLTNHQKEVYGEFIQNDLSLTELAQLRGISRQGAHDLVRRCERILADYESRLHLVAHFQRVKKMVSAIHDCAAEIAVSEDREAIAHNIEKISQISSDILEEY